MKQGEKAPDFTLPDQQGTPRSLYQLLEQGPVVLFFYPIASSSGCTAEACHFRDLGGEFTELGAQRVGISTDSVSRQQKFATAHTFDYPLLADEDGQVADLFGVRRRLLGKLAPVKRVTFVIDTDAVVLAALSSETKMSSHADRALDVLRARP
ncbi:peroxiredoxin [Rhodococcus sp. X156]|uniref:peroxiredoxin n=1 Tax=Rhodococcus sp. X156 TaxID=2499145 RepID=UPI000FD6EF3E|nr:peroxiredoxin [Rhodococcus sp. X156]